MYMDKERSCMWTEEEIHGDRRGDTCGQERSCMWTGSICSNHHCPHDDDDGKDEPSSADISS